MYNTKRQGMACCPLRPDHSGFKSQKTFHPEICHPTHKGLLQLEQWSIGWPCPGPQPCREIHKRKHNPQLQLQVSVSEPNIVVKCRDG